MIKDKVSNDVRAQEPGTELYATQAAKYTDELASVVKNNYPPMSTDWVYWFWKAWKKKNPNSFQNKALEHYQKTIVYRILIWEKDTSTKKKKIHNYKKKYKEVGIYDPEQEKSSHLHWLKSFSIRRILK